MTEPGAALTSFLSSLPTTPQLLALGEPTHGVSAFPAWRNRIFQTLVEQHGFRSIAIESDVIAGLRANAHVMSGQDTLDEVMRHAFSHGFGEMQANRELVAWTRQFNAGRGEADMLHFYGFDPPIENRWAASPKHALLALHAFLAEHMIHLPADEATIICLCGDDARWTNPAAALDPAQSVGGTGDAWQLWALADDLLALLEMETPRLILQADALWHARLHARTALGLLRYHANMADSSPQRVSRMMALRAVMMAGNLSAIAEREAPRGPTLVFAHNSHLGRGASRMKLGTARMEWWPAGAHLTLRMGQQYVFIAMSCGEGEGLPAPQPGTLEGWLSQRTSSPYLYATPALLPKLPPSLTKRTDTAGTRYSALEPEHLGQTDGVFFLPNSVARTSNP